MKQQNGFTLIEIALVLVVVGLILGGLLKGQALIENARVRSLANQIHGINAAWYAFVDRYRALPGDIATASTQLNENLDNGDGNGRVDTPAEVALVWQHLASGGFIPGSYDGAGDSAGTTGDTDCASSTCPSNPYGGFFKLSNGTDGTGSLHLITGRNISASALMQLDLKIDDGNPATGAWINFPQEDGCSNGEVWIIDDASSNCSGAWIGF
ncbi:MAG: prepilin-type N-terminal cleavage/methylation domain-containing protein [Pseudomonadota bacterium]